MLWVCLYDVSTVSGFIGKNCEAKRENADSPISQSGDGFKI